MPNEEFEISDLCVIEIGNDVDPDAADDVSDYFKTLKTGETVGNEDITTFGNVIESAKLYAYLLSDQQFDFDVLFDKLFWRRLGKLIRKRVKPVITVYPKGKVDGAEMWQCRILVENRNRTLSTNEVDKGTATMKRSGPMEETDYEAPAGP